MSNSYRDNEKARKKRGQKAYNKQLKRKKKRSINKKKMANTLYIITG